MPHRAELEKAGVLDALAEIVHDAILVVDEKGMILFFNRGAERIFGSSLDDVRGSSLDRFIPDAQRAAHREHMRKFGEANESSRSMGARTPVTGLRASGEVFPAQASIAKFVVGDKRYFAVILRDVTEISEARREIERLRGLLPICAYCRKVRDDSGYWQDFEKYVETHSNLSMTHGICQECLAKELKQIKEMDTP
jgi:PAS domain S-box-containing protein